MTYRLTFELAGLPPLQTAAAPKHHWTARAESQQWKRSTVSMARLGGLPEQPLRRARIVFTRFSTVEPDPANLPASFKPLEDGLQRAGVIHDDGPSLYGRCEVCDRGGAVYRWERAKRGEGKIRVEVSDESGF